MAESSEVSEVYRTMDLALRIGEVLLSSGAGAADVRAQMENVARSCGLRGFAVDVTFTELAMSHQPRPDEPALIQLRQVRYRQTDFGHLTRVDHLVRDLGAGRITRDAARALNRITSSGVPALVIVTAAVVPLLPGLSIYRALAEFSRGGTSALVSMATAVAIAIALSSGVTPGRYIAQPLGREARRVESRLAGPRLVGPLTVRAVRRRRSRQDRR